MGNMKFNLYELSAFSENIDRRKKKTQIAIESSLLELLEDKPLESITIKELSEKADINRKTFYNNYDCVEDVIESINNRITSSIFRMLPEKITIHNEIEIYNLLLNYATILEPHKHLLSHIVQNQSNLLLVNRLKESILPYIEKNLSFYQVSSEIVSYISGYVVNGIISIFFQWLGDDSLSANQVALLCYNLTVSVIKLDNYKDII